MPNDYDKIFKENFEELIPYLLQLVANWEIPKLEALKDKHQITIEREMDDLKKVVHDDPSLDYGLHWEVQGKDEDMRSRMLLYLAMFYHRYKMPLKQIVIYIGDEPANLIKQNVLEMDNVRLEFQVLDLRSIPKDVFLQSDKPECVLLAILSDFGSEKPEWVVRQILEHLVKLIGRVPRLKKYQKQLHVLSRLRKLAVITKNAIDSMPIHYDIETDELYLEGIEKGREQGIEQGIEKGVINMLKREQFTLRDIVEIMGASEEFVLNIAQRLGLKVNY